jgi:hypothetical protein
MTALLSIAVSVASILGIWTAVSLASAPVLVRCIRSQAKANDRRARAERHVAWTAASSRR